MITISIWKILVVMVVALLVLGPEQLSKVARMVGKWVVQGRSTIKQIQMELDSLEQEKIPEPEKLNPQDETLPSPASTRKGH